MANWFGDFACDYQIAEGFLLLLRVVFPVGLNVNFEVLFDVSPFTIDRDDITLSELRLAEDSLVISVDINFIVNVLVLSASMETSS